MTTSPGFSSRSTPATYKQLPQRDEAIVSEFTPGFSNSKPSEDAPSATVKAPKKVADEKVVDDGKVEDKVVKKSTTRAKKKP
jgi:hypothetical protein